MFIDFQTISDKFSIIFLARLCDDIQYFYGALGVIHAWKLNLGRPGRELPNKGKGNRFQKKYTGGFNALFNPRSETDELQ